MNQQIAIIGAGISGLSTAYTLVNAGYHVTVFAKEFSPNLVSNKAAAFWFPYHVRNDARAKDWCKFSYNFFEQLSANIATGISMVEIIKAVKPNVQDEDNWLNYMPDNSYSIVEEKNLPNGYAKAYLAKVPLIETQIFLPWLMQELQLLQTNFIQHNIEDLQELTTQFDAVINCTALGAKQLCNDATLVAVRGQVVLYEPGFMQHIFIDNQTPSYMVPRKDATIVGGTYEEGVDSNSVNENDLKIIQAKAENILPAIQHKKVIGSWAGVRPFRQTVRLEKEGNIIHNYGHGGSGYTLSFGCAHQVLQILQNEFEWK
jgi:D-amino-acid oxidase